MIEITYKTISDNGRTMEHKATFANENLDNVVHGAVSAIQAEWGETATEQAIKRYFNML